MRTTVRGFISASRAGVRFLIFLGLMAELPAPLPAAELARLTADNWDTYAPAGKEVDAIYGDFVLRNEHVVVVVANPIEGRAANMTVRQVGGAIIDLTERNAPNDQLSAFYPGARRYKFQLSSSSLGALRSVRSMMATQPASTPSITCVKIVPAPNAAVAASVT